jgi:glycosyltransferase involved in cell wall biosynthesis
VLLTGMDQANLAGLVAARLTGVPLVVSYHIDVRAAARHSRRLFSYVRPTLARWTIRGADHVVAVSEGARAGLVELAPRARAKITTIHNPTVGPELYALAAAPVDPVDDGPDRIPLDRTILAVGRLVPAKAFDGLVDAFTQVAHVHPDAHLLVLGDGPMREELRRRADAGGVGAHVHLPGYVGNPYPYMAGCRVFASSSVWEGLPTVLVEAGALGCRIVATDCPSGPREILGGRPQATLVDVGDVPGLARALDDALTAPHQRWLGDWRDHTRAHIASRYEAVLRAAGSRRAR